MSIIVIIIIAIVQWTSVVISSLSSIYPAANNAASC